MPAEPIRIVHIITGLDTGGAETTLFRLLSRLDRSRFSCTVFPLSTRGVIGDKIAALGIPVEALNLGGLRTIHGLYRLFSHARAFRPDIIQTWLYHADFVGLLLKGALRVPRLCWNLRCAELHAGDVPRTTLMLACILAKLSPLPDAVMVNSRAGLEAHEKIGYRPRRWELLYNGFDTGVFIPDSKARISARSELSLSDDTPVIGMVARFDPMKGHDNFLRAAAILSQDDPRVRFVLIGRNIDSSNQALNMQIQRLDLTKKVILLGERDDMPRLLASLDIAVCASSGEGMPNVVGEAMSCGLPCVATDVGDTKLLIGDCGELVPSRDPDALAAACRRLLGMASSERIRLGQNGRERVQRLFSLDTVIEKYSSLYEQIAHQ